MNTQTQPNLIAQLSALTKDERTIVCRLVERHYDLQTVARDFQLSIVDMLLWVAQPGIKAAMDTLRQLAEHALHLRSVEARRTAIDLLEHVALRTTSDLEKRRAAVALTRATNFKPQRLAPADPGTSSDLDTNPDPTDSAAADPTDPAEQQAQDPPAEVAAQSTPQNDLAPDPDPAQSVFALLSTLTSALARNDEPEHDTGLLTLHASAAPGMTLDGQSLPDDESDFITALSTSSFVPAIDAAAYSAPELLHLSDARATLSFTITRHSGEGVTFHVHLARTSAPASWQIAAIDTAHPNTD